MGEKRARRRFSREFKSEAVRQVVGEGRTQKAVAEELGINVNLLGRWIKQLREDPAAIRRGGCALPWRCPSVASARGDLEFRRDDDRKTVAC